MKICFIAKIFYPFVGGSEIALLEIAKRLAKRGHDIHVLTSLLPNRKNFENIDGIKIHRVKMPVSTLRKAASRSAFLFFSALALKNLLRKIKFDLVHDNISPNPSFAPIIAHNFNIPCTATVYDIPKWEKLGYPLWISFINNYQINSFLKLMPYDGFIAISEYTKKELRKLVKNKKIIVAYNGADYDEIDKLGIREKFNKPTIIYIGRFSLNKRVDWLLYITQELVKDVPNLQVLIVGDGPKNFKEPIIKLWKKLKLKKTVKFLGEIVGKKKIKLLRKSWILVLPSTTEGSPLAIAEAMACRIPVVASNVGGISEMIIKSGYLVNGYNIKDFTNKIKKLLINRNLRIKIGDAGRRLVETKLNWNKIASEYEDFFEDTLQK